MSDFQTVCRVGEIPSGEGKTVQLGAKLVAVFCVNGEYHAIDDTCPHMGASLSGGYVDGAIVTCPWHGWRFRLGDGAWADNPKLKIGCYAVRVEGDQVQLQLPSAENGEQTMTLLRLGVAALLLSVLLLGQFGHAQPAPKVIPRLEPIAETKLLMEGLAHANFKGLERLLAQKPADQQTWTFARGQALLIAEAANLFMLRPPQKEGQNIWFEKAMTLRSRASDLAQVIAKKDYDRARTGLALVADGCNRCHQSFRVAVQIEPFAEGMQ